MRKGLKEIILRWGEKKVIAIELGKSKNTISNALTGNVPTHSCSYPRALAIRRYVLDKFPDRYKDIKQ